MGFNVGQVIECIDDRFPAKGRLVVSALYRVTHVGPEFLSVAETGNALWLHERFQIRKRKTDISIFTSMLNPSTTKVKEREGV